MRKQWISCCLLLTLLVNSTQAQTRQQYQAPYFADSNRLQKLQSVFPAVEASYRRYATQQHMPGYAFGIMVDGQLVYTGTGGYTDIASQTPVSSKSMFRIASMSKSFTAAAILHLRDAGKLQLDDPVTRYIPELKGQQLTKDAAVITIRDLMSHNAGFPEDNPWGDRQLADTEADLLALIKKGLHFSNTPGEQYEYSNLGFAMLGYIIHKVSGKPYSVYIRENIWQPLGMKDAAWEYTTVPKEQLAHGYRWINNNWREETLLHDGIYGAMGGMISSLESFSRYMAMHMNAWPAGNANLAGPIQKSSLRDMHQPHRFIGLNAQSRATDGSACPTASAYGYGLRWTKDCQGRIMVGHSGGLPGFGSNWTFLPEYGIGVIFLANVTYAPTAGFNSRILDTLIRSAALKPRILPASSILTNTQKQLLTLLPHWHEAKTSGLFADNFFDDYSLESLQQEAGSLFTQIGPILQYGPMVAENQLRGYCIIEGTNGKLKLSFTLTPENPAKIQEYHLEKSNL
jgi:CubicO group peptidase (beta-lactamase class C family)